jgi:hypothetical protein
LRNGWLTPLCALSLFLIAGCSSAINSPVPIRLAESSAGSYPQLVPGEWLQMMLALHPNDTASLLSRYFVRPTNVGYTLTRVPGTANLYQSGDGRIFPMPDDDSTPSGDGGVLVPAASTTCSITKWSGSAPPPCDTTGPFRRAYSPGAYSGMSAYIQLPSTNSGMPKGSTTVVGYVYVEAWPGVNTSNSEYGLQYSATNNWYTQYIKSDGHGDTNANTKAKSFRPGDKFVIEVQELSYAAGMCTSPPCFGGEVIDSNPTCESSGFDCYDSWVINSDPAYVINCCFWARMTSIAQSAGNNFTDGFEFKNIAWSGAELGKYPGQIGLPLKFSSWTNGGAQDWPNDTTRIIVSSYSVTSETDSIDLLK